ncbi:MAG: NACHT domain-containing protein [Lachnospiraceae bacterium]|nr:NACHT domain-containing protein [Lachnospiraceae bacterium]
MEEMIIAIFGAAFRVILRGWTTDRMLLGDNLLDIEQTAQQCGLTIWKAKRSHSSMKGYIETMAEYFMNEFGDQIRGGERNAAILSQIQEDIEKINLNETELLSKIRNSESFRKLVMEQSEKIRETWSDAEIGLYTNCVRYISKTGTAFIAKLPNLTPQLLEVVIERQNEYQNDLCAILDEMHSRINALKDTDTSYREYESIYRDMLIEKYSKVELIGSGINNARNITRYDISSAYVELSCTNRNEYGDETELSQVFAQNNVVWIKGEAGSGKTTFLQWVAVCAAKNEYVKVNDIKDMIPIVIILRNTEKINLEEAADKITEEYGNTCPDGWISYLLKKNRAILLFDGIDETNQLMRKETYNFIERTLKLYPKIKILLTARNSVHDRLSCNSAEYEIMPMRTENIKKFITYWHMSVLRKDAVVADQEIDRLQFNLKKKIMDTPSLKVLAKNPLLCAMICALNYVNREQLPEDKIELYEKCCAMLIDERDNQRKIDQDIYRNLPRLNYSKKRKILEEISYWMMDGNISSANKRHVIQFLENLLRNTNILADSIHEYSAEDILNYLVDRSGIIREPENGVIDFIHKTFMEFLTVKSLCRNCAWHVLVREACNTNWKETIIMCFQEMGQENVEDVLKELIDKSKSKNDERYALIAALGASSSLFLSNSGIKEEINAKIKKMLPPKQRDLSEIAQAGTYLLPFLNDSMNYSNDEKSRCLRLLGRIGTGETIPAILSYVEGGGNDFVKTDALNLLSGFGNPLLAEYNVRERLVKILLNRIDGDSLTIPKGITDLIGNEELDEQDVKKIEKVRILHLLCGGIEDRQHIWETEIFRYFCECKEVLLSGSIQNAYFLTQFAQINRLSIRSEDDLSEVVHNLQNMRNLKSINSLYIEAGQLHFFHEKDLYSMKNIEIFEFHCMDSRLWFHIHNFDYFPKLRKVILKLNELTAKEVRLQISEWKGRNKDLEILVYVF